MPAKTTTTKPVTLDDLPDCTLVKQPQVLQIVPKSHSWLWRSVRAGTFPAPLKLSANSIAWRLGDIRAWLAQLQAA